MYEETEKMSKAEFTDNVMKAHMRQGRGPTKTYAGNRKDKDANVTRYKCGIKARKCYRKVWCSYCKNSTHQESLCKKKGGQDDARKVVEEEKGNQDHLFKAKHTKHDRPPDNVKTKGSMVDGTTSRIAKDRKN